jgi:hypothetical protein
MAMWNSQTSKCSSTHAHTYMGRIGRTFQPKSRTIGVRVWNTERNHPFPSIRHPPFKSWRILIHFFVARILLYIPKPKVQASLVRIGTPTHLALPCLAKSPSIRLDLGSVASMTRWRGAIWRTIQFFPSLESFLGTHPRFSPVYT